MCVMGVNAIFTTYHLPGFQRFCRKVVSNKYVTKTHNTLYICALEALLRFSLLTTYPGFYVFSEILREGGK